MKDLYELFMHSLELRFGMYSSAKTRLEVKRFIFRHYEETRECLQNVMEGVKLNFNGKNGPPDVKAVSDAMAAHFGAMGGNRFSSERSDEHKEAK